MISIGYNPDNNYVYRYMFGDRFEMHSNISDVWANFGIAGLLLLAVLAFILLRGIAFSVVSASGGAAVVAAGAWSVWNFAFSPIGQSALLLTVAVGMLIPLRLTAAQVAPAPAPTRARAGRGLR